MVEEISTGSLRRKLDNGEDIQVVDIREEHEVRENPVFVEDCIHIPMSRLTLELGKHEWEDEIYVICRHGNSSIQAARLLKAYEGTGERVASVVGGYDEWGGDEKLVSAEVKEIFETELVA